MECWDRARTLPTAPVPHGRDTVLVKRDRAGQAQLPSTLPTHTANEPLAPHLPSSFFPRHRKQLRDPQEQPRKKEQSHSVSQITRVGDVQKQAKWRRGARQQGEKLPDGCGAQTSHP